MKQIGEYYINYICLHGSKGSFTKRSDSDKNIISVYDFNISNGSSFTSFSSNSKADKRPKV